MFNSNELIFYQLDFEYAVDKGFVTTPDDLEFELIDNSEYGRYFSLEDFLLSQGVDDYEEAGFDDC